MSFSLHVLAVYAAAARVGTAGEVVTGGAVVIVEKSLVKLEDQVSVVVEAAKEELTGVDDDGWDDILWQAKHRLSCQMYRSASWEEWTESR
jgi:hypothetical protein